MAKQVLNNGMAGLAFRNALNSNFTELYDGKAPTNHATSSTTYGVATTTNYGHIKVTTGNGLNLSNGTLSIATSTTNQAVGGTDTTTLMTPAKVKEAVNAYSVITDGNVILSIGNTQPTPQSGKTIIWINTAE